VTRDTGNRRKALRANPAPPGARRGGESLTARQSEMLDMAPTGACLLSEEGLVLEANRTAAGLLGLAKGSLVDRPFAGFILPEDRDRFHFHLRQLLQFGLPQRWDLRMTAEGRESFWSRLEATAAWDGDGPALIRLFFSDITDAKQAEQALIDTNEFHTQILACVEEGLVVLDKDLKYCLWNPVMERITGLPAEQVVGKHCLALFPGFRKSGVYRLFERALAGEKCTMESAPLSMFGMGTPGWAIRRISPLRDFRGEIIGVIATLTDITDIKHAQDHLKQARDELERRVDERTAELKQAYEALQTESLGRREEEGNYRRSLATSPLGIRIATADGKTLYTNQALLDILGCESMEELCAVPFSKYYTQDSYRVFLKRFRKRLRSGNLQPDQYAINVITKHGEVRHLEVSRSLTLWGGKREYCIVYHDCSAREQAEEMRRRIEQLRIYHRQELSQFGRLAAVGEFTAAITHELSQPLSAIANNAAAARRFLSRPRPDRAESLAALREIIDNASRAGAVIRRFRSFMLRKELHRRSIDVNRLVADTAALIHHETDHRQVAVNLDLWPERLTAMAGKIELQQVLINLIFNGCDAMRKVAVPLRRIDVRTVPKGAGEVVVSVRDNGPGLDEQVKGRLFEKFYTTKAGGLGMGLVVSKRIIEAYGGRIWADNNATGGTTFSFSLPINAGKGVAR